MELWNGKPPWPPFWFCRRRPFPLAHTTFSLPVILFGCRKPSRSHQSGSFYLCRVSFPAYTLPPIISITLLAVFFLSLSPSWQQSSGLHSTQALDLSAPTRLRGVVRLQSPHVLRLTSAGPSLSHSSLESCERENLPHVMISFFLNILFFWPLIQIIIHWSF